MTEKTIAKKTGQRPASQEEKDMFKALVVNKDEESGKTSAAVEEISVEDLPHGEVLVAVEYSTVNYKDGLCVGPGAVSCAISACAGD